MNLKVPGFAKKLRQAKGIARQQMIDSLRREVGPEVDTADWLINQGLLKRDTTPDRRGYVLCDKCKGFMEPYGNTAQGILLRCKDCGKYKISNKEIGEWKPLPKI